MDKKTIEDLLNSAGFNKNRFEIKDDEIFFQEFSAARFIAARLGRIFTETQETINGHKYIFVVVSEKENTNFL